MSHRPELLLLQHICTSAATDGRGFVVSLLKAGDTPPPRVRLHPAAVIRKERNVGSVLAATTHAAASGVIVLVVTRCGAPRRRCGATLVWGHIIRMDKCIAAVVTNLVAARTFVPLGKRHDDPTIQDNLDWRGVQDGDAN